MDKFWDMTIDFLAKINTWIPLATVLWAGLGLIGVVLILAIAGCALRKRLVPQCLIWIYFIFATLIIFAQADGDIFTVVENMEVPCLVVLICYLLRLVFYRRPRYTYVERAVYAREIDKTPVAKEVKEEKEQKEDTAREVETTVVEEIKINEVITDENQAEVEEDKEADQEKNQAAEEKTKVETKVEVEDKQEDKEEKKEVAEKAEENTTVDMPVVEPIPDKTYEAPREPGIVTTPVSETIPELKSTIATASRPSTTVARPSTTVARPSASSLSSANRSSSASSMLAARSNATASTTANLNRPATTTTSASTTAARPNAFASMYNPRMVKTTTTTTTTTTTNTNTSANTLNATASTSSVRATSGLATGVNRTASATTTSTPKNPRSTDDIMAAIARLRASMKK